MSKMRPHPEDFSPYLDGNTIDSRYEELSLHLTSCPSCAEEVRELQKFEKNCRAAEFELDVPPFQWQRIQARLESDGIRPISGRRWLEFWTLRRLALQAATGAVLLAVMMLSGLEYRKYLNEQQLTALAAYSRLEQAQLTTSGNPFTGLAQSSSAENPFAQLQSPAESNPFVIR